MFCQGTTSHVNRTNKIDTGGTHRVQDDPDVGNVYRIRILKTCLRTDNFKQMHGRN